MRAKRTPGRFNWMEVGYWCAYGAFTTFAIAYVMEKGAAAETMGFMAAAFTLGAFLGQFVWGTLSDRLRTCKTLFLIGCALVMAANVLFFLHPLGAVGIALYALIGFIQMPVGSMLDTWVLRAYPEETFRFGRARACSTFAYAILMPVQGNLIRRFGYGMMPLVSAIFLAIAFGTALFTSDAQWRDALQKAEKKINRFSYIARLGGFLAILFGMGLANAPQIQLTALLVAGVGGNVVHQSYVMFANSIAMSPVLLFSRQIGKIPAWTRLTMASAVFVATLAGILSARSPYVLIACYLLNGLGSALYLPAMRQIMLENAPEEMQSTAQGLGDAVYSSMAGMVSSAASGMIIGAWGVHRMVAICLGLQTACALILAARMIRRHKG